MDREIWDDNIVFEPYAMKVARTVPSGGKSVRIYLSQIDTRVVHAVNDLHFVFSKVLGNERRAVNVTPCKYSLKTESKKIRPS